MDATERLGLSGVVPVVVLDDAARAAETAQALHAGGIDVMEITLRTPAGMPAIRKVAQSSPDTLVGAGSVLTLAQCRESVDAGARFIVSPGLDAEIVTWCLQNGVACLPGCVTPTEITAAMKLGLKVVKFFPANVYGGLAGMKALSAPFSDVRFVPTGGVSAENLSEYAAAPFVHAVGGSWLCTRADIEAGHFEKIASLTKEAVRTLMGFSFKHVGVNAEDTGEAEGLADFFRSAFGFDVKPGASSIMVDHAGIEIMRSPYIGEHGHMAILTNSIPRALPYLEKRGVHADMETAKYKAGRCIAVYLRDHAHGFGIHLLQK